ncbi:hypothetical protein MKK84_24430 [Methylobacterium sp. E-065]|uniref:hypothetical protein n=1 Tax=Methylobacterium sp. E-065 TaxID=2836583 RepID=UPI001FB953D5|nr:hypothetical protein [Methylobacterium sp. E-065]MCJ2020535.1 hypothetical protein [Methylobacterium sp. E-065]
MSVDTVRTQLAAIFAETHTNRQAGLVMRISRQAQLVMLGEFRPAVQPGEV